MEEWEKIVNNPLSDNSHVFFHPAVVKTWVETYLPLRDLTPLFVWARGKGNDNVGFLPLVMWRKNWKNAFVRTVVPVGYSDFDYHDPVFARKPKGEELAAFWDELIVGLSQFQADEVDLDGIRFTGGSLEWRQGDICPAFLLDGVKDREDLLKGLKTSLRGDVRRQTRRLAEKGELAIRHYSSYDEARETFECFLRLHSQKWPNAYKAPHFHENLLKNCLSTGIVDFSSLTVGDTPVAWHLGFHYHGRYYYYMPCGNPEFAVCSPVKVHLSYLMGEAAERGDKVFDHLRGEENYKSGWSNSAEYVHTLRKKNKAMPSRLRIGLAENVHRLLR